MVDRAVARLDERGRGTVDLDGVRIPGVRAVNVRTDVNALPLLTLEILARDVDLRQGPNVVEEVTPHADA